MVKEHSASLPATLASHESLQCLWERLNYVHQHHSSTHGKRGLLVYGKSGEGKTFAVKQYQSQFKDIKTKEVTKQPVFYYRLSESKKSVDDLLAMLILALGGTPVKGRPKAGELFHQFKTLIKEKSVELVIIDEIQQVLPKTDGQRALEIVKFLCGLIDAEDINTAFVFVGSDRAMRLLTFGQTGNTIDDNEQLSRRMLRPVKLGRIEPRVQEWVDVVNFFIKFLGYKALNAPDDAELFDRIYLAYHERAFSTLEDLFLGDVPPVIETEQALYTYLEKQFAMTAKGDINPFNTNRVAYDEVNAAIEVIQDKFFAESEEW